MAKQSNVNGFVKDTNSIHTLMDRVTRQSVQYHVGKFIDHLKWSIDLKEKKKMEINELAQEMIANKDGTIEGNAHYDADKLVQMENDWNWNNDQQAVAEEMLTYFKQASQQLFPQEHAKSQQNATQAEAFFTKSA